MVPLIIAALLLPVGVFFFNLYRPRSEEAPALPATCRIQGVSDEESLARLVAANRRIRWLELSFGVAGTLATLGLLLMPPGSAGSEFVSRPGLQHPSFPFLSVVVPLTVLALRSVVRGRWGVPAFIQVLQRRRDEIVWVYGKELRVRNAGTHHGVVLGLRDGKRVHFQATALASGNSYQGPQQTVVQFLRNYGLVPNTATFGHDEATEARFRADPTSLG